MTMQVTSKQALLVIPRLRIQNANAISSPLTHGFPSITAFMGLMWALERRLVAAGVPLHFEGVGVVCHHYQEQVTNHGRTSSFHLTRNPVDKDGSTLAIVEEGRIHLDITLIFKVSVRQQEQTTLELRQNAPELAIWAKQAYDLLSTMRVAGGSVLPAVWVGQMAQLEWIPEEQEPYERFFRRQRRAWMPGFALTESSALLAERGAALKERHPEATVLDAWLHASRANYSPSYQDEQGRWHWQDQSHTKGQGWIVPIPVGYGALTEAHPAGTVRGARDTKTPVQFVEMLWSLGQWVSPHRLHRLEDLLWYSDCDVELGIMRCHNDRSAESAIDEDADDTPIY